MRLAAALLVLAAAFAPASACTYSGSLSTYGGGIEATGSWAYGASLSWQVSQLSSGLWEYTYHWSTFAKDLSHIIIETSSTFTEDNIFDLTTSTGVDVSVGTFGDEGKSNPYIPEDIYGIKLDLTGDTTDFWATLVTDRAPVWADFYAKDGKDKFGKWKVDVTAYNAGFTSDDEDPLVESNPPSDGSVLNHILAPDTTTTPGGTEVPEPITILSMMAGVGAVGSYFSKRSRSSAM